MTEERRFEMSEIIAFLYSLLLLTSASRTEAKGENASTSVFHSQPPHSTVVGSVAGKDVSAAEIRSREAMTGKETPLIGLKSIVPGRPMEEKKGIGLPGKEFELASKDTGISGKARDVPVQWKNGSSLLQKDGIVENKLVSQHIGGKNLELDGKMGERKQEEDKTASLNKTVQESTDGDEKEDIGPRARRDLSDLERILKDEDTLVPDAEAEGAEELPDDVEGDLDDNYGVPLVGESVSGENHRKQDFSKRPKYYPDWGPKRTWRINMMRVWGKRNLHGYDHKTAPGYWKMA